MTPQLWVFAGPNGAGKSTLARRHACERIEVVSPDDIAREIARGRGGDPSVAGRACRLAIERRQALRDAHQSFGIETTLAGCSERAFMAETRDHGFKVNLVFVGIGSIIQSRSRVAERVKRGGIRFPPPISSAVLHAAWSTCQTPCGSLSGAWCLTIAASDAG
ncbi:AAA family ATPase [Methylobacterium brachiatum]|uniref:AAA family ATPase n=1 Tax=Methylobacterium brachiatum TaxID=269660 RepID=UPI00197BDEFD|nr:AAA family ATPase [Methylobacterium brachiatum]